MYRVYDPKEKVTDLEKRMLKYWEQNNTASRSEEFREGKPQFVFYEGPPTANGKPGIHHVMARTLKDTVCRYKTMQGFHVKRKAGWDTHGLPVEIEVEKQLGLEDKQDIIAYGMAEFNQKCRDSVFTYEGMWREMTREMGYWIDLENPYVTLTNDYIETVWWILNQFYQQDLIYQGHKIVPYCPKCGTPLSSHEVAQGYREVEDPSVYVRFKVKGEENTSFLAWTTTPWTLISNVALAVHPEQTYVKVRYNEEFLILAKARLSVLDEAYEIVEEFLGKDLEYKEYEQLFPYIQPREKAFYVGLADYVTMDDGTGIVHTAPAFGAEDYELGRKYGLPVMQPVDEAGQFTAEITDWAGQFVKDADKDILRHLRDSGALYKRAQVKHTYPFCWRCDSPLIYYARDSWYIRTSQFKELMLENNRKINWYPPFVGEKRFGEWLENNVDWAISRNRFWGTPLNIWICEKCGKLESIGSIAELREKGKLIDGSEVEEDVELHRPHVDDIVLKCPECGGEMKRTPEVIDCWFDSGSMPFAQWHYPFENAERFDTELFPADFISEGIDQTRGWFYSMLAISTMLKGVSSYKNVLVNDLILDEKGIKMSKTKGNTVDPMQMIHQFGADTVRWYLLAVSSPWVPTKFDTKGVAEISNKFFGTLKNVYSFYVTYANIDEFQAADHNIPQRKEAEIDRWITSRLHNLIRTVKQNTDNYDLTRSVRAIQNFVSDDLSNWYVRRSRRRYWALTLTDDKKAAYLTLWEMLIAVSKLMAPYAPFLADEIFINLTDEESVHLQDYPQADETLIDEKLEKEMQTVIDLVSLGRAARNVCQIKVRQPLSVMYIPASCQELVSRNEWLVKEEINVKDIRYIKDDEGFIDYDLKANFKNMGPRFGKNVKNIAAALSELNAREIVAALETQKRYELELTGLKFELEPDDLLISIKDREGLTFAADKGLWVALDTSLNEELVQEGLARELVNKIQFTRKDNGYEIMDRINISFQGDENIKEVFGKFEEFIKTETLTDNIRFNLEKTDMKEYDINDNQVWMKITKQDI
ncbi:MAG: isoleucine--tRNA ligase [Candidatus Cloacimonetes bacterium]|nr:isoleucine--tRNA ligase [Candidatus Cloacimonadota bacterium]